MRLFSIEGNRQYLDGGAMFGNAPKTMWEKWAQPDINNRIPLACRAFVLQTDDNRTILFETGIGAFFDPKMKARFGIEGNDHLLLNNLKTQGISEQDVDVVILSHLHFDHAGGLLPAYGEKMRLLFPHATYLVGKHHWERAQHPLQREKASFIPQLHELLVQSNRLELVEGEVSSSAPGVRFNFSNGHTIGLMLSEFDMNNKKYVFVSDLIPGMSWIHLPIVMGYDRFPELTVEEKKKFYPEWLKRSVNLLFTHDPLVACARLYQGDDGKFKAEETLL